MAATTASRDLLTQTLAFGRLLRAAGVAEVSSLVIEASAGGVAAEIIDLAKRTSDNLVAMSTHGASGLGRWLMGSVAERVVRYSSDPVLVIRSCA